MTRKKEVQKALDHATGVALDVISERNQARLERDLAEDERDFAREERDEALTRLAVLRNMADKMQGMAVFSGEGSLLADLYGGFGENLEMILESDIDEWV